MNKKSTQKEGKIKAIAHQIVESASDEKVTKEVVPIFYDGKQYTIRIPVTLAREAQIDVEKDKFNFELIQKTIGTETYLFGRIVRGNENEQK
jgi:hypothetical protein